MILTKNKAAKSTPLLQIQMFYLFIFNKSSFKLLRHSHFSLSFFPQTNQPQPTKQPNKSPAKDLAAHRQGFCYRGPPNHFP